MRKIFLVLILLLGICLISSDVFAEKPLKKVSFSYGVTSFPVNVAPWSSTPKFMKYWEEEGLDVTVIGSDGPVVAFQQLSMGHIQMSTHTPHQVPIVREKGAKIKTVASLYDRCHMYPAVLEESPIKDISQLKGKTIGIHVLGGGPHEIMKGLLKSVGIDPDKDVNVLVVGAGLPALDAVVNKKVDALMHWEAIYAMFENKGYKFRKFNDLPYIKQMAFAHGFFTTEEMIEKNPEIIIGLLRGMAKGYAFAMANPEATVKIHYKVFPETKPTGVDEATAIKHGIHILEGQLGYSTTRLKERRWGFATPEEIQALVDFQFEYGRIKKKFPVSEIYTDKFIKEVNNFEIDKLIRQAKDFKM